MTLDVYAVIPCHNEPLEDIEASLDSALAVADGAIVVADGRIDGGDVREFEDRALVIERPNCGGPAAALNTGIRAIPDGAVVCRLDVRDIWYPDIKRKQVALVSSGRVQVCASWDRDPVRNRERTPAHQFDIRIYTDNQFSASTTAFTRSSWERVGGYDETLRWCSDWDFHMKIQYSLGWSMFYEVTGESGEFAGGHSDIGVSLRRQERHRDRAIVSKRGQRLIAKVSRR